jgi:hypothetical protein
MDGERDFYGDEPTEQKICVGYCAYCKNEIFEPVATKGEKKVEVDGLLYHQECFILENTGESGLND